MTMRRPWIVAGLVLASLAATSGEACRRRLRDLVPPEDERTELETTLLSIVVQFEDCVEGPAGTEAERRAQLEAALARWDELYAAARDAAPPAAMTASPEEYRLVLDSIDDYARRTRAAWTTGDKAEVKRQEVALQHVVGELYGSNPGNISLSRAVHYTVTTFEHLPPLSPATAREWKVRADLLHLRLERWRQDVGAGAGALGSLRLLRSGVGGLLARLEAVANPDDAGAEPMRSLYVQEVTATLKDLDALAVRAPGAVLRASWSKNGVPEDLRSLPPRETYPALDRPPGG